MKGEKMAKKKGQNVRQKEEQRNKTSKYQRKIYMQQVGKE